MNEEVEIISQKLGLEKWQVQNTIALLNEKATIPFISRYRKEKTGNLDEVQIEKIHNQNEKLIELAKRKELIVKVISESGKLTDELKKKIELSYDLQEIEDLYLPFKPRRKTKADKAIELGLEPLAKILMAQNQEDISNAAHRFIKGKDLTVDEAIAGAVDIAAMWVNERQSIRQKIRGLFWRTAVLKSSLVKGKEEVAEKYKDYFDYSEPIKKVKSHRLMAVYRGVSEGFLKASIEPDKKEAIQLIQYSISKNGEASSEIKEVAKNAYSRLLKPSIETEVRNELKQSADESAIKVFAENLRQLLLQAPLGEKRILAIDPGFRSGCKVVCLDEFGKLLVNATVYPHAPQKETSPAMKKISTLVEQYKVEAIAIGNGTASRETESFIKRIHFDRKLQIFIVNEAGASIYSASKVAREEFPEYDVTVRGAVSIGRRLMDPLAELVKIDPKSIGVGQYQHDVDQPMLKAKLDSVVESCVNKVGVDLNTASKYLLTYVSGIGPQLAENIVKHRDQIGGFDSRMQLKEVTKLGPKAFEQSAGFLKITEADNPLDSSSVHPERYSLVNKIIKDLKQDVLEVIGNEEVIAGINPESYFSEDIGKETLEDIIGELKKPGRDPRRAAKIFEFSKEIRGIGDLKIGMELPGIVNNVTNFGAFVDIGIKENGLVHISNLTDGFVSDPSEVISLHQHVKAKVISVDIERKRIGLSLKLNA